MKVGINKDLCIGCGSCVVLCPDVFELDQEGKAQIRKGADLDKNSDCSKQAAESCPSQAINIGE